MRFLPLAHLDWIRSRLWWRWWVSPSGPCHGNWCCWCREGWRWFPGPCAWRGAADTWCLAPRWAGRSAVARRRVVGRADASAVARVSLCSGLVSAGRCFLGWDENEAVMKVLDGGLWLETGNLIMGWYYWKY